MYLFVNFLGPTPQPEQETGATSELTDKIYLAVLTTA